MLRHGLEPASGHEMEAESRPHSPGPSSPLQQVGLAGPAGRVVSHVAVSSEHLHLGLAAVNDIDQVLDGDAGLVIVSNTAL